MSENLLDRICDIELGVDNLADYGFMHYNVAVYTSGTALQRVVSVNKKLKRVTTMPCENECVMVENGEVVTKLEYPDNLKMIDESTNTIILEW